RACCSTCRGAGSSSSMSIAAAAPSGWSARWTCSERAGPSPVAARPTATALRAPLTVSVLRREPYRSTEDAIGTCPTTATAIGVRPRGRQLEVWAPFGTDDLFNLVVRPNRVQITPAIYDAKVTRWVVRWPSLVALPWEEGVGRRGLRRLAGVVGRCGDH